MNRDLTDHYKRVRALFATEMGEQVLKDWEYLRLGSVFDTDPLQMAYNSGQQDFVMDIRRIMEAENIAGLD